MAEASSTIHSDQFLWQRQLEDDQRQERAVASATGENDEDPATGESIRQKYSASPRSKAQQLANAAQEAKEKVEKAKKAVKFAQMVMRVINGVEAVSVVAIILAVITMHFQLVFGNLLNGAILPVPKLDWWEIAILLILDILLALVIAVIITVLSPLMSVLTKSEEVKAGLSGAVEFFKGQPFPGI